MKYALFATLVILACPEKLASIANTVAVERDWVSLVVLDLKIAKRVDGEANMDL